MLIICLKLFLHFLQLVFHWWLGHDFFLARWKAGKIARKNVDKWVVWILHRCEKQSYCRYCGKHCFETWKNSYSYCDVSCLNNFLSLKLQAKGSFHAFLKSDVFITNITSMIHELFITKAKSKSFFLFMSF